MNDHNKHLGGPEAYAGEAQDKRTAETVTELLQMACNLMDEAIEGQEHTQRLIDQRLLGINEPPKEVRESIGPVSAVVGLASELRRRAAELSVSIGAEHELLGRTL